MTDESQSLKVHDSEYSPTKHPPIGSTDNNLRIPIIQADVNHRHHIVIGVEVLDDSHSSNSRCFVGLITLKMVWPASYLELDIAFLEDLKLMVKRVGENTGVFGSLS